MTDPITQAIVRLFDTERFYAELILTMDRIVSRAIPTAGVCIKDVIQLHINPDFFNALTAKEQVAVLIHECKHILHDHIPRSKELAPEAYTRTTDDIQSAINNAKHQLINISADCAINPGITGLPEDCQLPKLYNLSDGQTLEWYVENLKDNEALKGLTEYDGHSLWAESDGEKEELKEKLRRAINNAAGKTRAAGKMSSDIELLIDKLNYRPRDWKRELNRFAAKTIETTLESSRKKRNRRYGIMYPGVVKTTELHLGVAIDTSGSISDEALCQFMAEIGNIAKYAKITVVEADSEVKNAYVYDPKKTYTVAGRGGTAYQPAFDYFNSQTEVDGVIYFGDMDNYDTEVLVKPRYPVLWAIVGQQPPPAAWGSITKIEVDEIGR